MATENFKEAGEIFQNAIEIEDPAKRERYLENACKEDTKLRGEVEALLSAHEKAGDYLEAPAVDANATIDGQAQIEGPGTKIGRYELLELIGEGGMGLVYLAEQTYRRGWDGTGLSGRAKRTGQTPRGSENHQARHGLKAGNRPLRGRATGPGPAGSSEYCPRI